MMHEDDIEDRRAALRPASERKSRKPWWKSVGPGLITGAADDDPSGIGTYSVAGAQFGYALLWLVPACLPLMIAVQEMCGRVASVTRTGLAGVIKKHYSPWLLWACILLLAAANTINVWADFNMLAATLAMLTGGSLGWWLLLTTAATVALIILVPYRIYVRYLKWLCLALLTYVVTALLPSVHENWTSIAHALSSPTWRSGPYGVMVVGMIGTTISPYLFFWQASETLEEKVAEGTAGPRPQSESRLSDELRAVRGDTVIGMLASQLVGFFIIICAAASLHGEHLQTAQQAARALLPLGRSAYLLFSIGVVGTGLLAIPTLAGSVAYAVAEGAGWRQGLYRRFGRARGFYLTMAAVCGMGYLLNLLHTVDPVDGLVYSAILNGLAAPPLIVVLLFICNNRSIMRGRENGWLSNLVGGAAALLTGVCAVLMFIP